MDQAVKQLAITGPRMNFVTFAIEGKAPLMVCRFSEKAKMAMMAAQQAGSASKSKKKRTERDFEADCEAARHVSTDKWDGIHAAAFRNGLIDACRAAEYVMTKAKTAVFSEPDGFDRNDGVPLVRIHSRKPHEMSIMHVRNAKGWDLRARPMWRQWSMNVTLKHDLNQFSIEDVTNLLHRVGVQIGVGEGRPYGRVGNGMGFGLFRITGVKDLGIQE